MVDSSSDPLIRARIRSFNLSNYGAKTDPAINAKSVFYFDTDYDGYGDSTRPYELCELIPGYSADNTDCNDNNAMVHPGGDDMAGDGIDGNCDGADAMSPVVDADGDGYDATVDCNDSNVQVNPGVEENYFSGNGGFWHGDSTDNDCDGFTDETWCDCYDLPGFGHPDYTVEQSPTNWAQRAVCDNHLQEFQQSGHWDCVATEGGDDSETTTHITKLRFDIQNLGTVGVAGITSTNWNAVKIGIKLGNSELLCPMSGAGVSRPPSAGVNGDPGNDNDWYSFTLDMADYLTCASSEITTNDYDEMLQLENIKQIKFVAGNVDTAWGMMIS